MTDEANVHIYAMVDQLIEGNIKLRFEYYHFQMIILRDCFNIVYWYFYLSI